MLYADVIVDISHENLDHSYQYVIPSGLTADIRIGAPVIIPFGSGNREVEGYVVGLSKEPKIEANRIKAISRAVGGGLPIESQLISLAYWMKETYGGTMNEALKTVIPVKKAVREKEKRLIYLNTGETEAGVYLEECRRKNHRARIRLLEALLRHNPLEGDALKALRIPADTCRRLEEEGLIRLEARKIERTPYMGGAEAKERAVLNREQKEIAERFLKDYREGLRKPGLLHGITGSGKTEIYMEIIEAVVSTGKQVIMLIPEIALTFQTVTRFYERFSDRVSVLHSRLSAGERYDQSMRAKRGETDIMVGPRSALFTPFERLGLIILDEEHEGSYKSENPPKYHARETAMERARLSGAAVLLGSATPSLESYQKAIEGEFNLYTLKKRAGEGTLPTVWIVDLREELKKKNKSIFSEELKMRMEDRLAAGKQTMLFINRRGYAGFVSCRSCGHVMKCPHCEVSLTWHNNGRLLCHYCGFEQEHPACCPECGSPYIAPFGTGTQKVEERVKQEFPGARVLRMDADTTSAKGGHEKILTAFAAGDADILVGTQMIVKGHDFHNVTLVGILAADLSLCANDYRAAERTFQLLTQAAGRAGRGKEAGEVVIQTYQPDHYAVRCAAAQDYGEFYRQEMLWRTLSEYPPASHLLAVLAVSGEEERAEWALKKLAVLAGEEECRRIGPAPASVSKIKDRYRWVFYLKSHSYGLLKEIKDRMEAYMKKTGEFRDISIQFDFEPINSY